MMCDTSEIKAAKVEKEQEKVKHWASCPPLIRSGARGPLGVFRPLEGKNEIHHASACCTADKQAVVGRDGKRRLTSLTIMIGGRSCPWKRKSKSKMTCQKLSLAVCTRVKDSGKQQSFTCKSSVSLSDKHQRLLEVWSLAQSCERKDVLSSQQQPIQR